MCPCNCLCGEEKIICTAAVCIYGCVNVLVSNLRTIYKLIKKKESTFFQKLSFQHLFLSHCHALELMTEFLFIHPPFYVAQQVRLVLYSSEQCKTNNEY